MTHAPEKRAEPLEPPAGRKDVTLVVRLRCPDTMSRTAVEVAVRDAINRRTRAVVLGVA